MKKLLPIFIFGLLTLVLSLSHAPARQQHDTAEAAAPYNVLGYAWSSNVGWFSMNCENENVCATSDYGVNLSEADASGNRTFSGYAWVNPRDDGATPPTNTIGWVSFNQSDLSGCPDGNCVAKVDSTGKAIGWARALKGENPNITSGDSGTDTYGPWGDAYNAPADNDTTPGSDALNAYTCQNTDDATFTDVRQTPSTGGTESAVGWSAKTPLNPSRTNAMAAMVGGKLYVIGGQSGASGWTSNITRTDEYDPATNSWTQKADMPVGRSGAAVAVSNGKIYVIGGYESGLAPTLFGISARVDMYDPSSNTWTRKADMPTRRNEPSAAAIGNKIYVTGGVGYMASGPLPLLPKLEIYDAGANSWSTGDEMPMAMSDHGSAAVNGKVYVMGGWGSWNKTYEYTPSTNSWVAKANMPSQRYGLQGATAVIDGKIHVVGGYIATHLGTGPLNNNEIYDPATNSWSVGQALPSARGNVAVAENGCKMYAFGGDTGDGNGTVGILSADNSEYTSASCTQTTYQNRTVDCHPSTAGSDLSSGWDGWIKLSGTAIDGHTYKVNLDTAANAFSGFAWGDDVIGWVKWDGVTLRSGIRLIVMRMLPQGLSTSGEGAGTGRVISPDPSAPGNAGVPRDIDCAIASSAANPGQTGNCNHTYNTTPSSITLIAQPTYGSRVGQWFDVRTQQAICQTGGVASERCVLPTTSTVQWIRVRFDSTEQPQEICNNGIDDNHNGQVDENCPPPPCDPATDPSCTPDTPEICGDNIDNNHNGQVDENCAVPCDPLTDTSCVQSCPPSQAQLNDPTFNNTCPRCNDGKDNDGDQTIDWGGFNGKPADRVCGGNKNKNTEGVDQDIKEF